MNFCGYETQLIGLEGGVKLIVTWPEDMGEEERQALVDIWEEEPYEGWEAEGWDLDDTEVWFWDDLNIELVESGSGEAGDQGVTAEGGWISIDSPPPSPGAYSIETVEKVVWPNFPITEANWDGKKWLDDDGDPVNVKHWRHLK